MDKHNLFLRNLMVLVSLLECMCYLLVYSRNHLGIMYIGLDWLGNLDMGNCIFFSISLYYYYYYYYYYNLMYILNYIIYIYFNYTPYNLLCIVYRFINIGQNKNSMSNCNILIYYMHYKALYNFIYILYIYYSMFYHILIYILYIIMAITLNILNSQLDINFSITES